LPRVGRYTDYDNNTAGSGKRYESSHNGGAFICRTKDGDAVLKNNGKGMPYIDLREFKAEAVLSFAP
jgi:hypothetical protein